MWRWSNRLFLLIALLLLFWVFAQDRGKMFSEMQPKPSVEAPVTPAPATMPPQEKVDVKVIETKPAQKPVKAKIQKEKP